MNKGSRCKKMKIVGIIAEYDPFHNGHAWQLAAARNAGAEKIIVCLSTGATQRGTLPLLPEDVRVRAALQYGADVVISLPAVYACAGAEQFAQAGVALLAAAGCDTLIFGAETPETDKLMQCAAALASPEYSAAVRAALREGDVRNYASARQQVMAQLYPRQGFAEMLSNPNDNLAVEYCKAILQQKAPLAPYALPRVGAGHGQALTESGHAEYASGSALRALWQTDGIASLQPYVRPLAFEVYQQAKCEGNYTDWGKVDVALLALLRMRAQRGFAAVRGVSEGLEYRMLDALKTATDANALYDFLTTVRYPRARMRRFCMDAAMGVGAVCCDAAEAAAAQQADYTEIPPLPPYIHLLGGRKESLGTLKGAALPVSASLAELRETNMACKNVAELQAAFADFAALCQASCAPMGAAYTKKIVTR